jgi:hypothetical protein
VTGSGLEELEEALLLQAELMELRASRSRRAEATVIEARVDKGQGPVATVVMRRGTLKVGGRVVGACGRVGVEAGCESGEGAERGGGGGGCAGGPCCAGARGWPRCAALCSEAAAAHACLPAAWAGRYPPSFFPNTPLALLLQVGQPLVVGTEWGRVRSLRGTGGAPITEVLPGQPVEIAGLRGLPEAGDQLMVSRRGGEGGQGRGMRE